MRLKLFKRKGNGHACDWIRQSVEHRAGSHRAAREVTGSRLRQGLSRETVGSGLGKAELKRCLEYLREGDTLLVTKIDRLARSTSDLYRIVSLLAEKGVAFKVTDDASIDTDSRTGKLVMGILALIAEFENDIRRERQMDGIAKAKERGVKFGRKPELTDDKVTDIKALRGGGMTVPDIIRKTKLSKASVYRALNR